MIRQVIRQFHFTKTERHGAAALLLLIGCTFLAPAVYPLINKPKGTDFSNFEKQIDAYRAEPIGHEALRPRNGTAVLFFFDPNLATIEVLIQLGVPERVAQTIVRYRERGGRFRSADDLGKIYTLPEEVFERLRPFVRIGSSSDPITLRKPIAEAVPALFPFDPNTVPESDLLKFGLPKALVGRLLKYREKGGFFFEKADFRKLYGLSETDYERLEPYISITRSEAAIRPVTYAGGQGKTAGLSGIEVNTAEVQDWQRLPGIGAARANQIIRFREKLGGFARVEQVAETYGLPDSVFQSIRPYLNAGVPVFKKTNLNTATEAELEAHPYINFKQAKLLVAYREQHGPYAKVEDIRHISALHDADWLEKVIPYLRVE